MPKSQTQTFVAVGQQGLLAELLGDPEETSAEVGCRRGVLRQEGGQAQQAGGLPQTLKVFGILRQPRAKHRAHRPAELRGEISHLRPRIFWFQGFWGKFLIDSYVLTLENRSCFLHLSPPGCSEIEIRLHERINNETFSTQDSCICRFFWALQPELPHVAAGKQTSCCR